MADCCHQILGTVMEGAGRPQDNLRARFRELSGAVSEKRRTLTFCIAVVLKNGILFWSSLGPVSDQSLSSLLPVSVKSWSCCDPVSIQSRSSLGIVLVQFQSSLGPVMVQQILSVPLMLHGEAVETSASHPRSLRATEKEDQCGKTFVYPFSNI